VTIVNLLRRGGINVTLAGLTIGVLRGSRGTVILPDTNLDAVFNHRFDMLILPGGQPGTQHLRNDLRVIQLLQKMASEQRIVAAICAAPAVLAAAGLLNGKRATCFPTCLDEFPSVSVQTDAIIEDGNIITSRGPGTAIDFALLLVERLTNHANRDAVEAGLVR
jgi:4-methyl-5(b-hydroxyethyl)-thiazole monophosphate biosynthesis